MKVKIFKRHPWLPLLLLNLFLVGGTWLLFAIALGITITENEQPDAVSRPLSPTILVLFILSIFLLLASLLAWFKWRLVTGKRASIMAILYLVVLCVSGSTTYFLTDTNPDFRTYEHLGYVYEIPREYSPNKYWGDNLSIKVCGTNPLIGRYDHSAQKAMGEPCKRAMHALEPLLQGYTTASGDLIKRELVNGEHGFTIATTTDALVLGSVDPEVLQEKRVEQIVKDGKVVFKSTIGGTHKTTFHLEFLDNELRWMTVCSLWDCRNYSSFPDNDGFVLRVGVDNERQHERGFLTDEEIAEYKVLSENVYDLFKSFRVDDK